jgi:hypothetical protein
LRQVDLADFRYLVRLAVEPSSKHIYHVIDLCVAQRFSTLNPTPFLQASATARRRRMLRDKHRMTSKRSLPSVVQWMSWSEPPIHNSTCVLEHDGKAFHRHASFLPSAQLELSSEG